MSTYIQPIDNKEFSMVPLGNLSSYLHWIQQIPMLSDSEEQDLATKLAENKDVKAARKLVLSHLRFVSKIARGYSGYGLSQEDLIQEGNIGLMKAVQRFNPKVGVRLASFAIHWIRAEIHEFVLRNWSIVKIATTKAQRKLFFNLRKMSKKLGWLSKTEAEDIAETLSVPLKDVHLMEQRLAKSDDSIYSGHDDDDDATAPINYLADQTQPDPADIVDQQARAQTEQAALQNALTDLNERERDIVQKRWLNSKKQTLQELADHYKISCERVRQLESAAMKKMRTAMTPA